MIQIDMPMPKNCAACIFLKVPATTDYFQCIPDGRYMYDDDKVWMTEKRPNWCPLIEQEDEFKRNPVIVCPHCGKRVK